MSDEDGDEQGQKKVGGKKLILFIALPIVLLGGAAGAAIALGLLDPLLGNAGHDEKETVEEVAEKPIDSPGVFMPLEEMTVTLSNPGGKRTYLVLEVQLELEDETAIPVVERLQPKIISEFTIFLRELRPEELSGSDGAYLVQEELYRRVSQVVAPVVVKDLLLVKMLVQ